MHEQSKEDYIVSAVLFCGAVYHGAHVLYIQCVSNFESVYFNKQGHYTRNGSNFSVSG